MSEMEIHQLQSKVVRDLAWVFNCPHIIAIDDNETKNSIVSDRWCQDLVEDSIGWLCMLDKNPSIVVNWIRDQSSGRSGSCLALGYYFAYLIEYWLRFCPIIQVENLHVATQLVSKEGRETVGQLKFLFRCSRTGLLDHSPASLHWESSVKFFLHIDPQNFDDLSDYDEEGDKFPYYSYVGPHLGENLAWRVREAHRKLSICQDVNVRNSFKESFGKIVSQYILRGYLFYPLNANCTFRDNKTENFCLLHQRMLSSSSSCYADTESKSSSVSCRHLRGWWTTDPSLIRNHESQKNVYAILPKLYWLSPVMAIEKSNGEDLSLEKRIVLVYEPELDLKMVVCMDIDKMLDEISARFKERELPVMIAELELIDSENGVWTEISRGFVLPSSFDESRFRKVPWRCRRTKGDNSTHLSNFENMIKSTEQITLNRPMSKIRTLTYSKNLKDVQHETDIKGVRQCIESYAFTNDIECEEVTKYLMDLIEKQTTYFSKIRFTLVAAFESVGEPAWMFVRDFLLSLRKKNTMDLSRYMKLAHLIIDAFESSNFSCKSMDENELYRDLSVLFYDLCTISEWRLLRVLWRTVLVIYSNPIIFLSKALGLLFNHRSRCYLEPNSCSVEDHLVSWLRIEHRNARFRTFYVEILSSIHVSWSNFVELEIFTTYMNMKDYHNLERLLEAVSSEPLYLSLMEHYIDTDNMKSVRRLRKKFPDFPCSSTNVLSSFNHVDKVSLMQTSPYFVEGELEPLGLTNVSIVLVETRLEILSLIDILNSLKEMDTIISIDCEWRPHCFSNSGTNTPVSLLQVCFHSSMIYLIDIQALEVELVYFLLKTLMQTSSFIVTGFCIEGDLKKLMSSFPVRESSESWLSTDNTVDIRTLALSYCERLLHGSLISFQEYKSIEARLKRGSLADLCALVLRKSLDKQEQCSDWSSRPLSHNQKHYAALDALCVYQLAMYFIQHDDIEITQSSLNVIGSHSLPRKTIRLDHLSIPLSENDVKFALSDCGFDMSSIPFIKIKYVAESRFLVKTIALKIHKSSHRNYIAVVLAIDNRVEISKLTKQIMKNDMAESGYKIELVTEEELVRIFGYSRGCLGPIGLRKEFRSQIIVILDKKLMDEEYILCGSGKLHEVYQIQPSQLFNAIHPRILEISE